MNLSSTLATLERLVAFDTVSSRSNLALIEWVANRLDDHGIKAYVQPGDEPGKANLFATIGPADRPGVMLSGHSDVVPVAGQDWTSDPFVLTERNGRWLGRGSADMKGFIACCVDAIPRLVTAKLSAPVHLALSYNEESNMHGMRLLAAHLASAPVKPAACIIGEPTRMQVVVANKGAAIYRCRVRGFSVHSSLRDQGVSAVEIAAEVIVFLNALQRQLNQAERHDGFEFPHTSVHAGMIQGGTAHNITAKDCEFVFEIRALPGVAAADIVGRIREHCARVLVPRMREVSAECGISIDEIMDSPGLDERGNLHLARALMPLCPCEGFGRVSFGTEAGMLQDAGVPTVVCGPGEIRVAHQPDEYVETDQLVQCRQFLDTLAARLERGPLTPA
ncbi:MAG: acetylornithine deacetylase [Burkholderiaceae bacterium]|nr:acetylornithine deacetylase [Burkholderiaceae bacterium]